MTSADNVGAGREFMCSHGRHGRMRHRKAQTTGPRFRQAEECDHEPVRRRKWASTIYNVRKETRGGAGARTVADDCSDELTTDTHIQRRGGAIATSDGTAAHGDARHGGLTHTYGVDLFTPQFTEEPDVQYRRATCQAYCELICGIGARRTTYDTAEQAALPWVTVDTETEMQAPHIRVQCACM